jgi:molybdate-binding protein/DNA-binding transcriptional regulator YhcF (GntR family)
MRNHSLTSTKRQHLYLQIAESIRRRIASGEIGPGDKLPPVRGMAQRWNCTPGTVSRAYSTLAQDGLVEGYRGGGTRVMPNALQPEQPAWRWASLVNQAEQYLLKAISNGYTAAQAETALSVAVSRWRDLRQQKGRIPPAKHERPTASEESELALHFAGSHDLLIESMARILSKETIRIELSAEYTGSLGGLMALAQRKADIAGTHLWDEETDSYNLPFVKRLLPGRRLALLTLAHRSLGLILPPGNPQGVEGLGELTRPEVRLVNRQPGSGTRVWLDAQLGALKIEPGSVFGYEREELTHLAVARAIAEGEATAGLGIYAAAAAYGLAFIPLRQERYELVIPGESWDTPAIQTLIEIVRSAELKETITTLGGYDTSESGRERWIS